MPRKCVAMPTIHIVQLIVNHRQRKREIAATLVFVGIGVAIRKPKQHARKASHCGSKQQEFTRDDKYLDFFLN